MTVNTVEKIFETFSRCITLSHMLFPTWGLLQLVGIPVRLLLCLRQNPNGEMTQSQRPFASGTELMRTGPQLRVPPESTHRVQIGFPPTKEFCLSDTAKIIHPAPKHKKMSAICFDLLKNNSEFPCLSAMDCILSV